MTRLRSIQNLLVLILFLAPLIPAADLSTYRGFQLGTSLSAAVKHSGMNISEVTTIHQRPALIQELVWNPQRFSGTAGELDSVQQVVLSFYGGQLFRMVVDYDNQKTEGLSVHDMIGAVSARYGTATRPARETFLQSVSFSEGVSVVACWQDRDYSLNLVQSPYGLKFGLIVFSKHLDGLAETAIAAGVQLDQQEAPQRQKIEEQNAQAKLDKARLANRVHFRP
jgi:hypothetical protein